MERDCRSMMNHNIEWYKCKNYGHTDHDCRSMIEYSIKENIYIRYKKVWKKNLEGQKEEACGLVLHINDESSQLKTGNQSNSLILKMGSILNESRTCPKIEDRKELVLHVKEVKEKQVNTEDSKDIYT